MSKSPLNHIPDSFGFRSEEAKQFPEMVVCGICFTCNARCIHCPNAATNFSMTLKGKDRFMSWETLKRVADECAEHPHNMVRVSSAGEVLVHPDAVEMIEYILDAKKDKNVALTTNGSLLKPETSKRLLDKGIRSIEISMDAASKETYEKIRAGLNYERVLSNIEELIKLRDQGKHETKVMISVIEQEENRAEIDQIMEFWDKIADRVLIRKLLGFKGLVKRGEKQEAYLPPQTPCPFLWERVLIDSAGTVRGCVSDIQGVSNLGSVHEQSISEIWQSDLLNKWREMHLQGKVQEVEMCTGCEDLEYRSWEYNYFAALSNASKEKNP